MTNHNSPQPTGDYSEWYTGPTGDPNVGCPCLVHDGDTMRNAIVKSVNREAKTYDVDIPGLGTVVSNIPFSIWRPKVTIPQPTEQPEGDWKYDYDFLVNLTAKINAESNEGLSMEEVEAVLSAINFKPEPLPSPQPESVDALGEETFAERYKDLKLWSNETPETKELDKAIFCLSLEVPESVAADIYDKWDAVKKRVIDPLASHPSPSVDAEPSPQEAVAMTDQVILEGNKLIAEFMGKPLRHPAYHDEDKLKYHTSWDWLMPVVEKSNNINSEIQGKVKRHDWDDGEDKDLDDPTGWRAWSYRHIHLSTNITSVWEETVEFLQWYNKNKPQ